MPIVKQAIPFGIGVVLALFALFGGISAITPSPNSKAVNVVNYDAR